MYTFGKIDSLREAAAHGIAVSQAQVNEQATKVAMLVYEAYMAISSPSPWKISGSKLVTSSPARWTRSAVNLKPVLLAWTTSMPSNWRPFRASWRSNSMIFARKELALTGLRTLLFLDPMEPIELADKVLDPQVRETGSLEQYITDARQMRPEFTQAREGVKAFEKLVDATKADYPVIFFGVFGSVADATNRDRIRNPFVYA